MKVAGEKYEHMSTEQVEERRRVELGNVQSTLDQCVEVLVRWDLEGIAERLEKETEEIEGEMNKGY